MVLFNKLDAPDFIDLLPSEAWAACEDFEDWVHCNAMSFSEDGWDKAVRTMCDNYARYYREYENE